MQLTIVNLSDQVIYSKHKKPSTSHAHDGAGVQLALNPFPETTDIKLPKMCIKLLLSHTSSEEPDKAFNEATAPVEGFLIHLSLAVSAVWRVVPVPDKCPWRLYISRISRTHQKLTILARRNLSTFLSDMPDRLRLSSLCLPGTHDTMAFYGWPISQCQTHKTPLATQLRSGVRVIDIRLSIIKSRLIAYHGVYPERTPFQDVLAIVHAFLTAPETSRETVVMSIKQEDFAKNSYLDFSRLVREEIFNGPGGRDMWFFENRIPSLGEVRGKVVLFSRFGGNGEGWENGLEGLGIHPLVWPDSEKNGFSWQCKDTLVRTHDWYNIPSFLAIPEKVSLATRILLPPSEDPSTPALNMSYLSAASFPFALPPTVAKGFGWPKIGLGVEGINSRFTKWLLDLLSDEDVASAGEKATEDGPRIRGWALMDYYADPEAALSPLLVECNYRGRRQGEEGW